VLQSDENLSPLLLGAQELLATRSLERAAAQPALHARTTGAELFRADPIQLYESAGSIYRLERDRIKALAADRTRDPRNLAPKLGWLAAAVTLAARKPRCPRPPSLSQATRGPPTAILCLCWCSSARWCRGGSIAWMRHGRIFCRQFVVPRHSNAHARK